jgi:hypothetical protein
LARRAPAMPPPTMTTRSPVHRSMVVVDGRIGSLVALAPRRSVFGCLRARDERTRSSVIGRDFFLEKM